MTEEQSSPTMVRPDEGATVAGLTMVHKVEAGLLEGGLQVMEGLIAPQRIIPPHTHSREDECSYILAGELMFLVGDETLTASTGSYVIKPRGVPHAFWNISQEPARVMEIHVPGTFRHFYDELGATMAADMPQSERQAAQAALHDRYGLSFHWDRMQQLVAKYGVKP
jgi:quercetin dioxygenase-like cupin family protein